MDFSYTAEQLELRKQVAAFALNESKTLSREFDEKSTFPQQFFRKIAGMGWIGLIIPKEYGGQGKGTLEYSILMEELAKQLLFTPQANIQVIKAIIASGTEEQKRRYLPKLLSGEYVSAVAISEPQTGSSFKNLQTMAVREKGNFRINGHKTHINLAKEADIFVLLALTDAGLSTIIVDKDTPGLSFEKGDPIASRTAPIYDIYLKDCMVPESNQLGIDGKGINTFFSIFNLSRIGNASQFIGWARGCLDYAVEYARNRKIKDNMLTDFQGIQWTIAELVADIESCRLLRDKAAWAEDSNIEHAIDTAMAKLVTGKVAERVVNSCFALVGGHGCYRSAPFERYWCEIMMGQVAGGSKEILKNTIAKEVLRSYNI